LATVTTWNSGVLLMPLLLAKTLGIVKTIGIAYCLIMDPEKLRALARANGRDKDREKRSHTALVDAIWEAADEGWQQVDIVRETGLTRERVRQICDPAYRARALERRGVTDPTS
jgi:hypothetical protein